MAAAKKPFSGVQVPSLDSRGKPIFIEISGVPFFNDKGKLLGFRGISRDITLRKKAEEAIAELNERFEMAQNAAGVGVLGLGHQDKQTEHKEARGAGSL